MIFLTKPHCIGQLCAAAIIGCVAYFFPGVHALAFPISLLAIWAAVMWLFYRSNFKSEAGFWALLFAMTMLSAGVAINVWYFTTDNGGTLAAPVLFNSDAYNTWHDLLYMHGLPDGRPSPVSRHGYTVIVYAISQIFGINILAPLAANMLATLLCILLTGAIAAQIFNEQDRAKYAGYSMVAITAMCYFLASGTILLKDALMCMTTALFLLCLLRLRSYRGFIAECLGLAFVAYIFYTVRPNMLPPCVLAIIILTAWRNRNRACLAIILIAVFAGSWAYNQYYASISPDVADLVKAEGVGVFNDEMSHRAQSMLIGDYMAMPFYKKILLLPMSIITQAVIPFPWNFERDMIFGPTSVYSHVAYPYYILLFFIAYYIIKSARRSPLDLQLAMVWAILYYCGMAYITAGSISRYALPLLPIFAPCAAYVAINNITYRSFKRWAAIYICIVAIGLVMCYNIQTMTTL